MKTIKQIAGEIGVSKQAVQKRISREPLCTSIQPYIYMEVGTKYIDETGEKLIKEAFEGKVYTTVADNEPIDKAETVDTVHTLINMLQNELDVKNKQIQELTAALENTTASLHAAQVLHAGTMQNRLEPGDTEDTAVSKNRLWNWFRKKSRGE